MGLIWDLLQESKINKQQERTGTLEERVTRLENELKETRELLYKLMTVLEKTVGRDIDGDNKIG